MSPRHSLLPGDVNEEIPALIDALHESGQRLEELTGGEVDGVTGGDGRTFLLQSAQDQLRHSEAVGQAAILNALPAHIALLDAQGFIISVNEAWRRFAGANAIQSPGYGIGLNYLDICDSARGEGSSEAHHIAEGIRSVLDGRVKCFSNEYPCHSPTEQRWFLLKVTPLADDHRGGAVVMHLNVTAERQTSESLHASELRFRQMAENILDVFFLISAESNHILYVSPAYEAIWGHTCESLYAQPLSWTDAIHPEDREQALCSFQEGTKSGRFDYQYRIVRPDGEVRWIRTRGYPINDSSGTLIRIASIAVDISERKKGEAKLDRINRVYAILSGINSLIVRVRHRQELFNEACRIAVEHGNFGTAWIGLFDSSTLETVEVAWSGRRIHPPGIRARTDVSKSHGVASRAIREKQVVFDNDIAAPSSVGGERRALTLQAGFRSMVALPFMVEGAVVGHLSLYAKEPDFFNEDELKLLSDLAGNISFALEHIGKEEKIVRLSRIHAVTGGINALIVRVRDRKALFDGACRIAVEHGNFGMAWIGTLDPATLDVTAVAWAGEHAEELTKAKSSARDETPQGKGAVGQSIRERRLVFNNDIANHGFGGPRLKEILKLGFRSQITLPLFENQAVIGTLTMYARESNFFDEEELKLLEELAGDISFALENISRQHKVEKLSRIRSVSSEINAAIIRIHDREALLRETCRIAVEHGKFELVWIALLDHEKQTVQPVAWAGFSLHAAHAVTWASISAVRGTLGSAIQTRKPAVRNDIDTELSPGNLRQEALQKGCLSTVCVPLVVDDKVESLISLFAPGVDFFNEEELGLLNEVAGNISFALEHIEKEEKIARLSRIQAVMGSINALIVRVRDRQELFTGACRIAVEHGGFGMAWIGVLDPQTLDVTPVAHAGFEGNESLVNFKSSASIEHPLGRGVVGRAIRERIPVVVDDLPKAPGIGERRAEAVRRGYHSRIALPLLMDNAVVGVMVLFAGERDFFNKEELKLLSELAGDISFALEHIGKGDKLNYLAYYDALTGLANRALLDDHLGRIVRRAKEEGSRAAVLMCDINRFRHINDTLGRQGGDALLRELGKRMQQLWPESENLGRVAADCFGGVIANIKDATAMAHLTEKLLADALRLPFEIDGKELRVSVTAGISMFPEDGGDSDTLLKNAEAARRKAKASGDRYLFYHPQMNAAVAESLSLENKLRRALSREQFVLHYQPKIDLAKGTISGLEALIRWNDPETGLVPPMKFIPLLEETGMIIEVGYWAMRKAVADYREWHTQGLQPPRIAVNVSAIQLRQRDFVEVVRNVIGGAVAGAHGLDLEITESLIMEDIESNIEKLRAVRELGVNIAIDDFGTGYSSLRYLAKLPVNALKIDRSFIITMTGNADSMAIVSTIISLAHALNLKVIAEGVDAEEQRKILRLLKCDEMQGYLFSRPVPKDSILGLLQADSTKSG
jgi:diguanylate cyclase (GGDEF)-like protein/PAS domain S-box-containing protein